MHTLMLDALSALDNSLGTARALKDAQSRLLILATLSASLIVLRLIALAAGGDQAAAETFRCAGAAMLLMLAAALLVYAASRYCNNRTRFVCNIDALIDVSDALKEHPLEGVKPSFAEDRWEELCRCERLAGAQGRREAGVGAAVAAFALATAFAPMTAPAITTGVKATALICGFILCCSAIAADREHVQQAEAVETAVAAVARKLGLARGTL